MANHSLQYENIVDELVRRVPELRPLLDEHIREYDEVLLHVFFGALTRYLLTQISERGSAQNLPPTVKQVLDFLDEAITSPDPRVQELVSVSFLENLEPSDPSAEELKHLFGPNLKRELERRGK